MPSTAAATMAAFALVGAITGARAAEGGGGKGGGGSGGSGGGGDAGPIPGTGGIDPDVENILLSNFLYYILASIAFALIIWRVSTWTFRFIRHVAGLNNETQRYFSTSSYSLSWLKKNVLYAPIKSKRHNREYRLSTAINVGTLPTRLQLVFLVAYLITNVVFCVINIPFAGTTTEALSLLRNRSGVLAVVNLIPLFLLASRNNPLIHLLGISFDTYNLIHRWLGRIIVLESLVHVVAFLVSNALRNGVAAAFNTALTVLYMKYGFIATVAFIVLAGHSFGALRHAFYESFKVIHIVAAITAIVGVWYHLYLKDLPQLKYMYAVIVLWLFDRVARVLRVVYYQAGSNCNAVIEALPSKACRVTVSMARPWAQHPGQHAYLYLPTVSYLQSHPFSVAWSQEADRPDGDKLPMDRQDVLAMKQTSVSFIVRSCSGATKSLYEKAAASKDGRMVTKCLVEGPYGGVHRFGSYGTVMLFAGGVGITQMVPHVRDLVVGYSNGTVATRKVVLVWSIQSPAHLEWIRPWMTEILAMERRREVLRIMLFVSRPRSTKEIHSPSATVQMFPGRPNIDTLLGIEMENQVGAMAVTVCGPGSYSDDVRAAVRNRQYHGSVDFIEEAFSW